MYSVPTLLPLVQEPDPVTVTPGAIGFLAVLFVGVLTILLLIDMTRRMRRLRYRLQVNEELDAEETGTVASSESAEDTSR